MTQIWHKMLRNGHTLIMWNDRTIKHRPVKAATAVVVQHPNDIIYWERHIPFI